MSNSSQGQSHAVDEAVEVTNQDWQTSKATVVERAKHLLNSGLYTDCEFLVGADGGDQEIIKANRTFLGMTSPVFDKMFSGKMTEGTATNQPIIIPDLTPVSFKDLLMYMYSDSLDLQSIDQALGLWEAAQKYILPDLVAKCITYVKDNLCPKYTIRVIKFIKIFEDETIKEKCLSLLRERTLDCLVSSDFEDAHESTVLAIVKEETLTIRELELFDAVVRWAKRQCIQRELEIDGNHLRQVLKEIIYEIRFLAMTSEEFSSSPALSGILSEKECFAIYQNINNPDSWPFPIDLSSIRKSRQSSLSSESVASKIQCLRPLENKTVVLIEPSAPLDVSLTVDKDVMITGIIISHMRLQAPTAYYQDMKLLCKLYQTHHTYKSLVASVLVSYTLLDPSLSPLWITFNPTFDRPVELKRDRNYLIRIAVTQRGPFMSGTSSASVSCQGVCFKFASNDVARNGVVRGVTFYPC